MKHRLVIFTGKGGVGKTTLAMAYTLKLNENNTKVKFLSFNQDENLEFLKKYNIPYLNLNVDESAEIYIAQKLNSKTIASFVMSTHFFKALFNILPSLKDMILIGHILKILEEDPKLTIVLDSPATGHALSMFESANNFKKIFKHGLIVDDILKMKKILENPTFLKTFIVTLPNEMAWQETNELLDELKSIYKNTEIIINNSYKHFFDENKISRSDIPLFLANKITFEEKISANFITIPYFIENDFFQTVIRVKKHFGEMLND
jgi:anion-transporting  ArsA/GET3 family ATPase